MTTGDKVRIDKWLWAARFFKTRALAKDAVDGGKVHYNGQRCKPGKTVDLGTELTIRQGHFEKVVIVEGLSDRRKSAPLAQLLYKETEDSQKKRERAIEERKHAMAGLPSSFKRPTKRDRRRIHRFKNINSETE
jgi:ribosome-associated heat shock protein Hsp15